MQETLTPIQVEKENIVNLSFKNVTQFDQNPHLQKKLEQATRLGNMNKVKYHIDF